MSKKSKLIILDMFILGVIVFGVYLIKNNYINYALIVFAIAVSFIIQELTYRFTGDTKEEKYETKLKKILKTYDSVLVETRKVPVIDSEKVILVNLLQYWNAPAKSCLLSLLGICITSCKQSL